MRIGHALTEFVDQRGLGDVLAAETGFVLARDPDTVREKVAEWLDAGTEAVWIVDPRERTVAVHLAVGGPHLRRSGEVLRGGRVLPGFELPLARLFHFSSSR